MNASPIIGIQNETSRALETFDFYSSPEEARTEILRRFSDAALKEKVLTLLGGEMPAIFGKRPRGVLFRHIATPNHEYFHAKEKAEELGLDFLYLEYIQDKFCSINWEKRCLGRINFFQGRNRKGENIIVKKNIFDITSDDGKNFSDIQTFSGENLVAFHHRLLAQSSSPGEYFDISTFLKKRGKNPAEVYPFLFLFFTCFGVLLEGYNIKDGVKESHQEKEFVEKVVKPAYQKVQEWVGVSPLIVKIYDNMEEDLYWHCYPQSLQKEMLAGTHSK